MGPELISAPLYFSRLASKLCCFQSGAERTVYDVVAANILPSALIGLAPDLAAAVRGGGALVASGVVAARAQETADAVGAAGFGLEERRSRGDWVGMVFRKP